MVKLEEVQDEAFLRDQPGPIDEDGDWDTDTDSILSTASSEDLTSPADETLLERLSALRDIIPPHIRRSIASRTSTASAYLKKGGLWGGKALWVVSTSMLLLGVPWALACAEEQQMVEAEKEMQMQKSANEMLTPGATTQPQAKAAL